MRRKLEDEEELPLQAPPLPVQLPLVLGEPEEAIQTEQPAADVPEEHDAEPDVPTGEQVPEHVAEAPDEPSENVGEGEDGGGAGGNKADGDDDESDEAQRAAKLRRLE